MLAKFVAIFALGYFVGAIPTGLIIGKLLKGVDIREYGSGKTGAANVLRAVGMKAGALTMISDLAKGAIAVLSARWILGSDTATLAGTSVKIGFPEAQVLAAWAAMVGHNWSMYIKFGGGRGVDTFFGALMGMSPIVGLSCGVFTLAIMAITRYISLGSILGTLTALAIVSLLAALGKQPAPYAVYALLASALILWQHRDNIQRLRTGKERKLGQKAEKIINSA